LKADVYSPSTIATNLDRRRVFGGFSIASGALSLVLILSYLTVPPGLPEQMLSSLERNHASVVILAIVLLTWMVISIPFVVGLGILLRSKSGSIALAATFLSAGGILVLGFGNFIAIGALLSIEATAKLAPNPMDPAYQAAIWGTLMYFLTDPGLMTWGLGQFLFGWLAWKSDVLSHWLAIVGVLGGISGLLTLAIYQNPALAFLQIAAFAIWGLVVGVQLLKRTDASS
jgi:Domain of unknown function (DUF4386)